MRAMGAGRWGALCLMATVGCRGEPAAWNPCDPQPQVTLGRAGASLSAPFVLGDETGFVVFWGGEVVEADPGTAGVFAARRDSGRVTLVPGVNAQILSSVVVEGGYLVCWADGAGRADELDRGGCGVVDRHLGWIRPDARPSFGIVLAMGRIDGHLHALVDDGAINDDHYALIPLDETGEAVGAPVDWPCAGASADVVWGDAGLGCLRGSKPGCGRQFDEPPDCVTDLDVFDGTGARRWTASNVAPFGIYGSRAITRLAANEHGFTVAWQDHSGALGMRLVEDDGTVGPRTEVTPPQPMSLVDAFPVPGGTLLLGVPSSGTSDRRPLLHRVDDDASAPAATTRLGDASGALPLWHGPTAVGTTGGATAIAWLASSEAALDSPFVALQNLGCGMQEDSEGDTKVLADQGSHARRGLLDRRGHRRR